ncbi:MAG: hypothetical protein LBK23_11595, partial [Oscillospiraceae bacterium]|nr:hypothetical protein [Oscillospiraceae bacterium]
MKTKRTFTLTRTIILALTLSLCVGLAFPAYAAPLEIIPSITINIPGVSSIRATFTNVYAYYEDGIVSEADIDDTTDEAEMPKVGDKYCSFTFESGGLLATQYPELGGSVAPPGYDTLKKGAATFSEDIILMQGYGNTAVSPTGEVIAESFRIVSETVKKGEVLEEPEGYFKCKTDDGETLWVVLFGRDPRNGIDNF